LQERFGQRADPDTWWPIYYGRSDPPAFERVITNILVQQSYWPRVQSDLARFESAGLLTASALAATPEAVIAASIETTGLRTGKARALKAISQLVVDRFGTEAAFCSSVSRQELLALSGIGDETADRILLYACSQLAWPVDTYCFRVLAHHQLIPVVPTRTSVKKRVAAEIKELVLQAIPPSVEDWQRLHALMQLEGERLRG
jgi:endonuclease-3 related protein